ncbi:MAG: hypothetical protein M0Q43_07460 [Methanothrix sp.]|jgi:hypothetical protein|nr:hypothetical protein [Methanothrix sp.]
MKYKSLEKRLLNKINQILENPSIGDPKRHALKHARGSHVDPYVIGRVSGQARFHSLFPAP